MIAELLARWCATHCSFPFVTLEARAEPWAVGPLVLLLEWRRKAKAVQVEPRWLQVLVRELAGGLVVLGLAEKRQANHLSERPE